jgi:hypothetical protein
MKWPWQREKPVRTIAPPVLEDETTEELARARAAAAQARNALVAAQERRPQVAATGRALKESLHRNHFAELVRGALGSGR